MGYVCTVHRVYEAHLIHALGHMGKQFADRTPALAVLAKLPRRPQQVSGSVELDARLWQWQRLAVVTIDDGLGIKGVNVRDAAEHEQKDDTFGAAQ